MFTRTTAYILIAALAAGLGLFAANKFFTGHAAPGTSQLQAVRLFDPPRTLPDFRLRQSDGTQLVPGELKGHWTLVFLGFTHCPDVCPTTLAQLSQAQKQWEGLPESTRPRVLFVSVDPERDTPDAIGEYTQAFHPDTLAATANVPALEAFAQSLSLVFVKKPAPEGRPASEYTMDHSAVMAVLDPQGRMSGIVSPPLEPQKIADDFLLLSRTSTAAN